MRSLLFLENFVYNTSMQLNSQIKLSVEVVHSVEVKFLSRFKEVQYVLQSKYEELRYLNYDSISVKIIWEYCVEKKWRKKDVQQMPIHEMVSDIFRIAASDLIHYIQISEQKSIQNGLVAIDDEEMEMLMGKKSAKHASVVNENDKSI